MSRVVDTNVVAYLLLGPQPFDDEANQFWLTLHEPIAPAHWESELANAVWLAVRARVLRPEEGLQRLDEALRLGIRSVPVHTLWLGALDRSIKSGVAIYDTLFVELAEREGVSLATFDKQVLTAFPAIAKRPRDLLA